MVDSRRARMTIPPSRKFLTPALDFISSATDEFGVPGSQRDRVRSVVRESLESVISANRRGNFPEEIALALEETSGGLQIQILNRGFPVFQELEGLRDRLSTVAGFLAEDFSVDNLGREGQRIAFYFPLGESRKGADAPSTLTREDGGEIEIRPLRDGEEEAISALFFNVYEYKYINEDVYYPARIREMRESGRLISFVGVTADGRIVAHVGLVRLNTDPMVYEAAWGITDPRIKSRGLFSNLFQRVMDFSRTLPMSYCVFDCVTNHDFSQKLIARDGSRDMALFVGCQTRETQASLCKLGLGEDPLDMDRYTLLLTISPRMAHPFGREIVLPSVLGEKFGFVLKPLGLDWIPASRFDSLSAQGKFSVLSQPAQKAIHFELHEPGRAAVKEIAAAWQRALSEGFQYASVNVPVQASGLGALYDALAMQGFFVAGFIPYRNGSELGFRFQALAPTRVAFDQIRVVSEVGRRMLECVREDYERNRLL